MTDDGQNERNPYRHGRRETDAIGVEFERFKTEMQDEVSRWLRKGLIAFGIIGVTVFIALLGVGFVFRELDDVRASYVRAGCEATNQANSDTSSQLIALSAVDEFKAKTPAAKAEVRGRRDVTLALIDALAPAKDCDYQVALALGDVTPTPVPTKTPSAPIPASPTSTP